MPMPSIAAWTRRAHVRVEGRHRLRRPVDHRDVEAAAHHRLGHLDADVAAADDDRACAARPPSSSSSRAPSSSVCTPWTPSASTPGTSGAPGLGAGRDHEVVEAEPVRRALRRGRGPRPRGGRGRAPSTSVPHPQVDAVGRGALPACGRPGRRPSRRRRRPSTGCRRPSTTRAGRARTRPPRGRRRAAAWPATPPTSRPRRRRSPRAVRSCREATCCAARRRRSGRRLPVPRRGRGERAQAEPLEDRPAVRRTRRPAGSGSRARRPRRPGARRAPCRCRGRGTPPACCRPTATAKSVPSWKFARAAQVTVPSSATASHIEVPARVGRDRRPRSRGACQLGVVLAPHGPVQVVDPLPVRGRAVGVLPQPPDGDASGSAAPASRSRTSSTSPMTSASSSSGSKPAARNRSGRSAGRSYP